MKIKVAALLAISLATVAAAAELPLTETYGTSRACRAFALGGTVEVQAGAPRVPWKETDTDDPLLLVSPEGVFGVEWGCSYVAVEPLPKPGYRLTMDCAGEGESPVETFEATLREDGLGGLTYQDKSGTQLLQRCNLES